MAGRLGQARPGYEGLFFITGPAIEGKGRSVRPGASI